MSLSRTACARWLALASPAFLACSLAVANPGAFVSPSAGERFQAGTDLVVQWDVSAPEIQGRNEMELVLSLDGGATFPIRLTGRIQPGDRRVDWRVPALPTEHARIALRAGSDEERETEALLFISEPFSIASTGTIGMEELFVVGGEWRTREALEGAPAQSASGSFSSPKPEPAFEPVNAAEAGIEDGAAVATTIDLHAAGNELPSLSSRRQAKPPATPRKAALQLRL